MSEFVSHDLYGSIKQIIENAHNKLHREVNRAMVDAYWQIGELLVNEEQQGKQRAEYGTQLIQKISRKLIQEFGKGFSTQNFWNLRQFYQKFSSMWRKLSRSSYKVLLRVEKQGDYVWYMREASDQNWTARALERQVNSLYYDRLLGSRDKKPVHQEVEYNWQTGINYSILYFSCNGLLQEFMKAIKIH